MDDIETTKVKQDSEMPILMEEIPTIDLRGMLWIVASIGLGIVLFSGLIGRFFATSFESGGHISWNPDEAKSNAPLVQVFGGLLFLGTLLELGIQRIVSAIHELKTTNQVEEKPHT